MTEKLAVSAFFLLPSSFFLLPSIQGIKIYATE
jgi:hypothetical protein